MTHRGGKMSRLVPPTRPQPGSGVARECPRTPDLRRTPAPQRGRMGIVLESLEVMIGKRILVGITYLGSGDEPDDTVQLTGTVTAVEPLVTIDHGQPAPFTLPPLQDAYDRAPPGKYTLRGSGEVVENPDFIATWTVSPSEE